MNKTPNQRAQRGRKGRTIAIGDVHGCAVALRTLLAALQPTARDEVITLGDVIDNGPDSRGVIDQVLGLAEVCHLVPLLGNHEAMLLDARGSREKLHYWLQFGGAQTLDSYGPTGGWETIPKEHIRFIETCRPFYETETHIFAHANCDPEKQMTEQPRDSLVWQFVSEASARPHYSGKTVVVGHTPQLSGQVLDLGFLRCIDTGCWQRGWLTALDVISGTIWQANELGESRVCQLQPAAVPTT